MSLDLMGLHCEPLKLEFRVKVPILYEVIKIVVHGSIDEKYLVILKLYTEVGPI